MKQFIKSLLLATMAACCCAVFASEDRIGASASNPSPSPDGKQVVFSANYDAQGSSRLWVSGLDGSGLRKLATSSYSLFDQEPAWSPDGGTIVFSSSNGTTSDIWLVGAQGARLTQLTSNALNNHEPAWSPDGRRIAFVSDRGGSNDIWLVNADGTGLTRLTKLPGQENHPSFSPDGSQVVFSATVNNAASLMAINTDGSNLRQVTPASTFNDWSPSWGSGGIIFSSNRDVTSEHWKIWTVQADGSSLTKMSDNFSVDPAWTKSGGILFSDPLASNSVLSAITLLDPKSGGKRIVTNIEGFLTPIDIRPFKLPNYIRPDSEGHVSVAILSTKDLDAVTQVDQTTLRFGHSGTEASLRRCKRQAVDVNRDGKPDLICRFTLKKAQFRREDKLGILRFRDLAGTGYEGRDTIVIVDRDDDDDFKDDKD